MNTVRVDLSFDQLKQTLHQLPAQEKIALWRMLDKELDRPAIARRFATTVKAIRRTYAHVSEEELMADAINATGVVRRAKNPAGTRLYLFLTFPFTSPQSALLLIHKISGS